MYVSSRLISLLYLRPRFQQNNTISRNTSAAKGKYSDGLFVCKSSRLECSGNVLWSDPKLLQISGTWKPRENRNRLGIAKRLFMWRRCRHVGGQKQYIFSPLASEIYFHAKLFHCFSPSTWLPWKPSIAVDIYRASKRRGKYPLLFTDNKWIIVLVYTKPVTSQR